ncbi:MAG: hypothetical protein RIG63_10270 [Coleofasciculus chthonoplastes F3-SA18-01]|uniref:hypothetical protein n=2 Tax=Coleofasciculaceae TaxID=1892251 RepID=UPI003302ADE6
MMTNDPWYEAVDANTKLTQGDIIFDCPVVCWASQPIEPEIGKEVETLKSAIKVIKADVVVMTQACDLENNKVENVILCPHLPLERYKEEWENFMKARGQTKLSKAWVRTCEDIKNGYIWNLAMLNEGITEELSLTHRVVDFQDVYTLPRIFLESLLQKRGKPRLRLRPPYREHLSQAFARFFMRVGLPMGVTKVW